MDEEKKNAVDAVLQMAADSLPPPPSDVVSRELLGKALHIFNADINFMGDIEVPNGLKVRTYKPTVSRDSPLPLIFFCHGGGWFAGNLDTEDRTCRIVCSTVRAWVVSVDYRCGFTVPLEHMVDDCYSAFEWAHSRATESGADPHKSVVWGGSAGGALAIAVVWRLVQTGKTPAGLCAMNGTALHPDATPEKYKHLNTSYVDNAGPLPFVSGRDTIQLYKHRNVEPPNTDISIFPAAGGPDAVSGFPPTYLITSDNDASRDDGTVFEAVLRDAGVRVKRENIMGLAHYFWSFDLPKANANFWSKLCAGIRWTLEEQ